MATFSPNLGSPLRVAASQEAEDAALMQEIRTGERLRRQIDEAKREQEAAQSARRTRGHKTVEGLGRCVLTIPGQEFFTIGEKVGSMECWHDKEFIRYVQKKAPHLRGARV